MRCMYEHIYKAVAMYIQKRPRTYQRPIKVEVPMGYVNKKTLGTSARAPPTPPTSAGGSAAALWIQARRVVGRSASCWTRAIARKNLIDRGVSSRLGLRSLDRAS